MTSRVRAVPVGLLGDVRMTMSGFPPISAATAMAASRLKSARRPTVRYLVKVSRAYCSYMEYVGENDIASRPGPPNAEKMCSMTSLEPLAGHTLDASTLT